MSPETLQETFEAGLARLAPGDASRVLRGEAMVSFSARGYPTRRHEDWRYTDLKPIVAGDFDPTPSPASRQQIEHSMRLLESSSLGAGPRRLVFVDGEPLSTGIEDVEGLAVLEHDEAWRRIGELQSAEWLESYPLAALNTAFTSAGTLIRLREGVRLDEPLHLVFVSARGATGAAQPRLLIDVGAGAELTIVQHFLGDTGGWTNAVTQITQGDGSRLTLYRVQEYGADALHTELLEARLSRDASVRLGYVDLGGRLVRNDAHIDLAEPGAACELFGVFLASHGQHVDNHTRIDHSAPYTTSREAFRGIVGEQGHGVFNGKVVVHRGARGTDAQQSSDNLLLSQRGEIDTKPELEIYADDVKCAHGATVGALDPQQLFYVRSRGVDEATAKGLLTFAFANEVLRRIEVPEVRERVAGRVAVQLPDYESWGGLL